MEPALGRFTTVDPLAEKYYSVSPYAYVVNNPVRNIDFRGDSVTVLNLGTGTNQHMALLIQNKEGKWQYFSFNGDKVYQATNGSLGGRPFDDIEVGSFDSPEQFLNSGYNQKANTKEDKGDPTINAYGYQEGYILPTTSEQDNIINETFKKNVLKGYNLLNNQCATATQKALNAAGIKSSVQIFVTGGFSYPTTYNINPYLPSAAFNSIKNNNPIGKSVYKTKK